MGTLVAGGPNADQIKYWNEISGPKWVALHDLIDTQIAPLGLMAMERTAFGNGERVIDVGCGCGSTTIEIGRRIGANGEVLGVDLSTVMLDAARGRAARLPQVRFENADVQTHLFPRAHFDVVFSRFGVMFFADPAAAFANLRAALRPGGRVSFVCWQALQQNPWMFVPFMAAAPYIELPAPPAPDAPGPFSFADPDRVRGILQRVGFANIHFESVESVLSVGGGADLDRTVDFLLQMGPTGAALRTATAPARVDEVSGAIREALTPYVTPQGVRMPSAAWIVEASCQG